MTELVAKYVANRRPMQSNNNDPRLRALYKVMQESRHIADAAEADYLFYQEAKCCANELFQWMRSSGYALVYDGMWKVAGFEHLQSQPTFCEALLSAWNARESVVPASMPEDSPHTVRGLLTSLFRDEQHDLFYVAVDNSNGGYSREVKLTYSWLEGRLCTTML